MLVGTYGKQLHINAITINYARNNMENTFLLSLLSAILPPLEKFEIKFMIIGLHRCNTAEAVAVEGKMVSQRKYTIRLISISVLHLISGVNWLLLSTMFSLLSMPRKMYGLFHLQFSPSWLRDSELRSRNEFIVFEKFSLCKEYLY